MASKAIAKEHHKWNFFVSSFFFSLFLSYLAVGGREICSFGSFFFFSCSLFAFHFLLLAACPPTSPGHGGSISSDSRTHGKLYRTHCTISTLYLSTRDIQYAEKHGGRRRERDERIRHRDTREVLLYQGNLC